MGTIVHLIWSFNIGGAETMLMNLVNEQVSLGANVKLVIINNNYDQKLLNNINKKVEIFLLNRKPGSKSPIPIIKLNLLLLRIKPMVVHCHVGSIIDYIAKPLHKKTVLTMHTTGVVTPKKSLCKYSHIYAISDAVKDILWQRFNIHSTTIMNGVVFDKIICKHTNNNSNKYRIVQIGRLVDNIKGQSVLLQAVSLLPTNVDVKVDIVGDGPDMKTLRTLCRDLGIESKIDFLGARHQEYIQNNLHNYDMLIQPSYIEGFGLTIVEAMAAKVPVIVSDIDGTSEVVENGKYGTIFHVGDYRDLAEKIVFAINNIEQLNNKALETYYYAKEKFSLSNTAKEYIKYYKTI